MKSERVWTLRRDADGVLFCVVMHDDEAWECRIPDDVSDREFAELEGWTNELLPEYVPPPPEGWRVVQPNQGFPYPALGSGQGAAVGPAWLPGPAGLRFG